jgi:hypothetical protein|tara:strand:+ start:13132 stop:13332 length:201 start_codon:yes stop_codon:yes gene_type:complete
MNIFALVIEQIKKDIESCDQSALYEMLVNVPQEILVAYLPEDSLANPIGLVSTSKWLDICNEENRE